MMLVLYIIWSLSYFPSRLTLSCPLMFSSCVISPVNVFQFYPLSPLYFYNPLKVKVKSLSPVRLFDPMDCSLPGSSVHGVLQARILEWVAISFSRGSSQSRDQTQVSCIAGRHFTLWTTFSTYLIWSMLYFKADNFYGLTYYFLNCKWWKFQVVEIGSICILNMWLLFILLTGPRFVQCQFDECEHIFCLHLSLLLLAWNMIQVLMREENEYEQEPLCEHEVEKSMQRVMHQNRGGYNTDHNRPLYPWSWAACLRTSYCLRQ